jgi:hypothetical protein
MKVMRKSAVLKHGYVKHTNKEREILSDMSYHPFIVGMNQVLALAHVLCTTTTTTTTTIQQANKQTPPIQKSVSTLRINHSIIGCASIDVC